MDVKGITWVGNVYQKFEAMCLEVEELMYQDTVKYVENQVQNVGASVKRFYSDVMQDLLSPTSLDAEKVSPFCFPVEQDSDDGICRKTNASKKKEPSRAGNEQSSESLKVTSDTGEDVGVAPLIHVRLDVDNLCRPSGDFSKGACSGLRSRKRRDQSKCNSSNFCINQNRHEEKSDSVETSHASGPPEKYLSRVSSSYGQYVNEIRAVSKDLNEDSMSHTVVKSENASRVIADSSNDFQSSNEIVLIESAGNDGRDIEVPSSGGILAGSYDAGVWLNNSVASVGGSSQNEEACHNKYFDEEIFMPQPSQPRKLYDWNLATDIKTANEHEAETIQQSDKTELEETIVVVNEDDLRSLPQRESKKRPYKKKIREALYSRMRSGRKHEYEQLALQYGDGKNLNREDRETLVPTVFVEDTKLPRQSDSCESEWELL